MSEITHSVVFKKAVEEKKSKLTEAMTEATSADLEFTEPSSAAELGRLYDRFEIGTFKNLERIRARWLSPGPRWRGPDLFEFIPKQTQAFTFVRHTGEPVKPSNMITDIGTIPRLAGLFRRGLTPWGYAPAYICHDWEFEDHHCGATKSFGEVRDTVMEVVKTLMETELVPRSLINFSLVHWAVSSPIARRYWNRNPPECTLPPPNPEP